MKAKKEWSEENFEKVIFGMNHYFKGRTFKNHKGEIELVKDAETTLGMPYTSTSKCAMMSLDCNVKLFHPYEEQYSYSHVIMTEDEKVVLILMDKDEDEMMITL